MSLRNLRQTLLPEEHLPAGTSSHPEDGEHVQEESQGEPATPAQPFLNGEVRRDASREHPEHDDNAHDQESRAEGRAIRPWRAKKGRPGLDPLCVGRRIGEEAVSTLLSIHVVAPAAPQDAETPVLHDVSIHRAVQDRGQRSWIRGKSSRRLGGTSGPDIAQNQKQNPNTGAEERLLDHHLTLSVGYRSPASMNCIT